MKFGVILFPGSNCDDDMVHVLGTVMGRETVKLWHKDEDALKDFTTADCVIVPGGFSYGDYVRAGAVARFSPIMESVIDFAKRGGYVFGICNGFQVLVEAHLLPGGLIRNEKQHFICRDQKLRVENNQTAWTNLFDKDQEITIPLKNGEGGYIASKETLKMLEAENRVVFRYLDLNPNGSMSDIAGLTNERGNVLGLMPHPEHAVEPGFGPDTDIAMRSGTDGLKFFESVLKALVNA